MRDELEPLKIYVPEYDQILVLSEGSGDNLTYADRDEGYIDYVYYAQYSFNSGDFEEIDGGMLLVKEFLRDTYESLRPLVVDVLDMAYDSIPEYIVLSPDNSKTKVELVTTKIEEDSENG